MFISKLQNLHAKSMTHREEWDLEDISQIPKRFIRFTIDPSLLIDQPANDAAKNELKEALENYLL